MTKTDHQLLAQHLSDPTGPSLGTLIDHHLPLVHSVARRITANDEAARDISQTVFLRLVKKAKHIPASLPLTAWFHRETHSASVDHVRSEVRRQRREQTAASLNLMTAPTGSWDHLAPEIDDVINELSEADRALVLLRFYENKTHAQIATELDIQPDAARMRTNRALDKLRTIFSKRGITTTVALLASTLPTHAVSPAPPALGTAIVSSIQVTETAGLLALLKAHSLTLGVLALGTTIVATQQVKIHSLQGTLDSNSASQKPSSITTPRPSFTSSVNSRKFEEPDLLAIFANPDLSERLQLLHKFGSEISISEIPDALDLLHQKTPEWDSESKMLIHLLITRWAKADPKAAFASLDQANFTNERGHASSILSTLASLNPRRAANWLTAPSNKQAYYPILGHILAGTIAKEWARQDSKTALTWAKSLPDQQQAGAYSGILGTISSTDPQRASSLALSLDSGEARDHILGEITISWARQSPEEALAWTSTLGDHEKPFTTAAALRTWAITDPEKAARYLDQKKATEHLSLVAERWARLAPEKAASWVLSKPQGNEQHQALGRVLWNWTTQDPSAATTWIESQPQGAPRDHAIAGLTAAAALIDPETSLTWAQKIANESLREKMTRHTLSTWHNMNPEAAQQWSSKNPTLIPTDR